MKLNLAENIRRYRRQYNWTQEMLAERLGVSFRSVSRWENGTSEPDLGLTAELARIFGCTVDALLGVADAGGKPSADEIRHQLEEAMKDGDAETIVRILRRIRLEYCEEFDCYHDTVFFFRIAHSGAYLLDGVRDEFRLLVKDFLGHAHDSVLCSILILVMSMIETEENAEAFIMEKANGAWDLTADALRRERYRFRGDAEKFRQVDLRRRYRKMVDWMVPDSESPDAGELAEIRLAMLRAMTPGNPDCRGADIWAGVRLKLEIRCAKHYAACGRYEDALLMLERLADRADALAALPNRAVLPCDSPEFCDLPLMISRCRDEDGNIVMTEIATLPADESMPYGYDRCDMYQLWVYATARENEVFAPLRENERFIRAFERLSVHDPYEKYRK